MKYTIFDKVLESNIPLPELKETGSKKANLFFCSSPSTSPGHSDITWNHHWRLPNGLLSISSGKRNTDYWLLFPQIAHFRITPSSNSITSYQRPEIPANSIRHLLLDQVIPRLLSHKGEQVLHASAVQINNSAILFSGESGWGKSTIASFFHAHGHPLLTDDCMMLKQAGSKVMGTASYCGARLFQDILTLLPGTHQENSTVPVSHYGTKKRLRIASSNEGKSIPVKAIFILNNPELSQISNHTAIMKICGAAAAMALVKNCFPLDISDTKRMGKQLQKLACIGNTDKLSIYSLNYPRKAELLPYIMRTILTTLHPESDEADN